MFDRRVVLRSPLHWAHVGLAHACRQGWLLAVRHANTPRKGDLRSLVHMRVIYIAGAAHSGSTLLDLMLNAHPDIVSVGEVLKLNRQLAYRDTEKKTYAACSCGAASLWDCKFWSAVDTKTRASTGKSIAELEILDDQKRDS